MSSKGMPSTAARRLVETVCSGNKIPLFVLHDFDKSGMSIAAMFKRDARRYQYDQEFESSTSGFDLPM
jgi:DNA topoisomerase VI subunit A